MESPLEGIPITVQCRIRPRGTGAHGAGDAKVPDQNTVQLMKESGAPPKGEDLYKIGVNSSYQCVFDKVCGLSPLIEASHNRAAGYSPSGDF